MTTALRFLFNTRSPRTTKRSFRNFLIKNNISKYPLSSFRFIKEACREDPLFYNKYRVALWELAYYGPNILERKRKLIQMGSSITLEFLILKYGDVEGTARYIDKNERSTQSLENCIRRHGEELGKIKYQERCDFQKYNNTIEYYIEKHGEVEGRIRYEKWILSSRITEHNMISKYGEEIGQQKFKTISNCKTTSIEYYLNKGLSQEEAEIALSERQSTFSLDKCIQKYGEEEGKRIWKERQDKWQERLNSKTIEELERINSLKSTGRMNALFERKPEVKEIPGIIYYIRFYNEEMEFWKIGITSQSISRRFGLKSTFKANVKLNYDIIYIKDGISFYEAFKEEQKILRENSTHRISINYNGFITTEAFAKDITK